MKKDKEFFINIDEYQKYSSIGRKNHKTSAMTELSLKIMNNDNENMSIEEKLRFYDEYKSLYTISFWKEFFKEH